MLICNWFWGIYRVLLSKFLSFDWSHFIFERGWRCLPFLRLIKRSFWELFYHISNRSHHLFVSRGRLSLIVHEVNNCWCLISRLRFYTFSRLPQQWIWDCIRLRLFIRICSWISIISISNVNSRIWKHIWLSSVHRI